MPPRTASQREKSHGVEEVDQETEKVQVSAAHQAAYTQGQN